MFYCRRISIDNGQWLTGGGPLLIAANHPNSFLDAVIIATIFKRPVYSLVRGDTFKHRFLARLLKSLNMLPVYRVSEGSENLTQNYDTFDQCKQIFRQGGIVLMFSEGACINEWRLRPLKKGTARLAVSSWNEGIPLRVLPAGLNYQSFDRFGKNIILNFGDEIKRDAISATNADGATLIEFNEALRAALKPLVIHTDKADRVYLRKIFGVDVSVAERALLFFPAIAGCIIHAPLYLPIRYFARRFAKPYEHFDSIMIGLLFFLYPLYLASIVLLVAYISYSLSICIFTIPVTLFTAWSHMQVKRQF